MNCTGRGVTSDGGGQILGDIAGVGKRLTNSHIYDFEKPIGDLELITVGKEGESIYKNPSIRLTPFSPKKSENSRRER